MSEQPKIQTSGKAQLRFAIGGAKKDVCKHVQCVLDFPSGKGELVYDPEAAVKIPSFKFQLTGKPFVERILRDGLGLKGANGRTHTNKALQTPLQRGWQHSADPEIQNLIVASIQDVWEGKEAERSSGGTGPEPWHIIALRSHPKVPENLRGATRKVLVDAFNGMTEKQQAMLEARGEELRKAAEAEGDNPFADAEG